MSSASFSHPDVPAPVSEAGAKRYPLTPAILLSFVQDAVIGTDLAFHITSWNPGAEALYGWSEAEVLGQTVRAVLHTQFLDDEEEQVLAQFQAGGTWRGEVRQQHRDGHALAIMATVALVRSPTGEPLGAVSVNRDISERKAAEQACQRAADRLHVLAEASRAFAEAGTEYQAVLDQIAQLTADRLTAACTVRLLSEDAQWLDVCAVGHYRPAERETLRTLLTPERLPVDAPNPAALAVRSGQPQLTPVIDPEALRASVPPEHQAILAQFFPRSRLTVPLCVQGHPIGSLACARFAPEQPPFDGDDLRLAQDLADRAALAISNARLLQQAQAARQVAAEALARLDALITSLPTGVGYMDHTLRYQLVNPALTALNGRPSAEHVGRTMSEVIPALAPRLEPLARQVLATGEAVRDLELHSEPCRADMAAQAWLISYFPVRDAAGMVTGVGVTVTDITAITHATAALRETEHKLTTLFELLPVGVSIFDAAGAVVAMNPAQEAIFRRQQAGVAREGVLERPFFRPDGTPQPREELATERALRERQPALNVESGFISGTGELHWLNASAVPVEFSDWRVVAVASDITERMQAERALAYERQQLAAILTTMHEGVIASRPDGTLILINPAALRLGDLDPAHPPTTVADLGRTPHQLLDAHGQPLRPENWPLSRVLRGERFAGIELCQRSTHAGAERWLLVNGTPVFDTDGALLLGVITFQDLTARKRDEATLCEQAAMLDHAHSFVCDPESRILAWNQGAQRLYGWTAAEALGRVSHELLQPRFPTALAVIQARLLATGRWEGEQVQRRRDGREVVVASLWVLFRDASGAPARILEVNNDVTAQRRAEQALRERDAQLRLAHDAAQLGTWWRDPTVGLVHFDARAQTHFGLAAEVTPLEGLLARIHPDDQALWRQAVMTTSDPAGDGRVTTEYRVVHPDGSIHWLAIHARAYYTGVGDERCPAMTSGTVQDITARKQAEAALQASEARFRLLAEHAQDLIYRYRLAPEPGFEYVSPSATAITGYTPEEHYADPQLGARLVEPADRHLIDQATAGQTEGLLTLRWRRKDGMVIWTEQLNRLILDAAGQPVAIEGIARDITARKQAEALVRAALTAEQQARAAAELAAARVSRLQALTAALAATLTLDDVMQAVLDPGHGATGAVTGVLALLTAAGDRLEVVTPNQDAATLDPPAPIPLDAPLPLAQALRTQTAVWVESQAVGEAPFPDFGAMIAAYPIATYVALPLTTARGPIGVLSLGFSTPQPFPDEERALLEAIAQQCAQALERARLYAEVQAAQARLQQLSQRLLEAQEQERRHIARELHDEVGQTLGALKINLHMLSVQPDGPPPAPRLAESLAMLDALIQVVRALSLELRPSVLDDLGLSAALAWYCDRLGQRSSTAVSFEDLLRGAPVPPVVATTCFRIAQEALTNVLRHAQARRVTVTLSRQEALLVVSICDDGAGFDVADRRSQAAAGSSLGIISMRERAELVGGWVDISSSPHDGTEVWAWLPLV